jgi:hypothetical protein
MAKCENPDNPENPENPDSDIFRNFRKAIKFHQHWHGKM